MSTDSVREDSVYMAKLAEQAERYDGKELKQQYQQFKMVPKQIKTNFFNGVLRNN